MLVTFEYLASPSSVIEVKPFDLETAFGAGVTLRSITLETTTDSITKGKIEQLLSWLGPYPEPGLCPPTGRTTNIPFCRRIQMGSFIRRD